MNDCLLAATGAAPIPPWMLLIAAGLLAVGIVMIVAVRRGRSRALVSAAVVAAALLVASPVASALPAFASDRCAAPGAVPAPMSTASATASATPTALPSPVPTTAIPMVTPTPTPTPTVTATVTPTPTPSPTPTCPASDKSTTRDLDRDGVVDACDLDSDNDGILDTEEDFQSNGIYEDDDVDGDLLVIATLGDGVSSYADLDSDNDGLLDLFEGRPFTAAQIDAYDADHDGVFDAGNVFGVNGLLDALETSPDSGVLLPALAQLRNTDEDDKPDFIDLMSNRVDYDLHRIERSDLDQYGAGFISRSADPDGDGIQEPVDTAPALRGAPRSPLTPYL